MSAVSPLPCPFCGSKAETRGVSWHKDAQYLGCFNEECPTEPSVFCVDPSDTVPLWNTRAPVADPAAQLLVLADAMPDQPVREAWLRALAARERGVS